MLFAVDQGDQRLSKRAGGGDPVGRPAAGHAGKARGEIPAPVSFFEDLDAGQVPILVRVSDHLPACETGNGEPLVLRVKLEPLAVPRDDKRPGISNAVAIEHNHVNPIFRNPGSLQLE